MTSSSEQTREQSPSSCSEIVDDAFHYTHIFYITGYDLWNPEIKIHNISQSIKASYPSEDFKKEVEAEGQARANSVPEWIILKPGIWKPASLHTGSTTLSTMSDENRIATWIQSKQQYGKNTFTFPEGSTHCGHTVAMEKEKTFSTFDEMFVVESVPHYWRYNGLTRRKFTLWKVEGENKRAVALYKGKKWLNKSGVLLVNADEVDCVLAAMSMTAMLRKVRQRG